MIAIAEVSSVRGFLEPISIIGTCATEAMWDAARGGEPEAICRYCEGSRQRDAPRAGACRLRFVHLPKGAEQRQRAVALRPVPLGLRPGRSSASLPGLTISTYGLRRAPRIRSVLATTHHAPIIEIGSGIATGRARRVQQRAGAH